MKRAITVVVITGLVFGLSVQAWAGGARGGLGSSGAALSRAPGSAVSQGWRYGGHVTPGYGYYHRHYHPHYNYSYPHYYPYYYYPYVSYYNRYYPPVVVVSPYYSSYPNSDYAPAPAVSTSPFYCAVHRVGFVSRVGFLDHLGGTHKIPLETAESLCPEGSPACVIEGY